MAKCQYTEYQRYSNHPKHTVKCSINPTYKQDKKQYCFFHYLRLFFNDLSTFQGDDNEKRSQLSQKYPYFFDKKKKFTITPITFYQKFNELLAQYNGKELNLAGFVFPTESIPNNEKIELIKLALIECDIITINIQFIDFYNNQDITNFFSNGSYSNLSLNNSGTIRFYNINCKEFFIFKPNNENIPDIEVANCNITTIQFDSKPIQNNFAKTSLKIEKSNITNYNHDQIINTIYINKSTINNISQEININSFSLMDSTILSPITIEAIGLNIENSNIGHINNRISKVSLTAPFNAIGLNNNILQDPLFSFADYVEIKDKNLDTTVYDSQKGKFYNVDMRNLIFLDAKHDENKDNQPDNLKKINFMNCKFNTGHKLYEDGVSHKRLEYSYLYLRELYDERGEYIAGNDFHYNYYETKRKHDKNLSDSDKFFLWLFSNINGHNTKPIYTVGWLIILLILFWNILEWCSFYPNNGIVINTTITYDSHSDPLEVMGGAFYTATSGLLPTSLFSDKVSSSHLFTIGMLKTESILSTILLLFFGLAIRNRFRRSKEIVDIGITGK